MRIPLALLLALSLNAGAQQTVDVTSSDANMNRHAQNISGTALGLPKFTRLVEGTPYFSDQWMKGTLVLRSGQEFKDVALRLDLLGGQLIYRSDNGQELVVNMPVREVVLVDSANDHNYRFFHGSALGATGAKANTWYLWLASGKTSLYKQYRKKLTEFKPYGSATTEQKINTYDHYLVLHNDALLRIEKLKDAPGVLAHKKGELEDFIKTRDKRNASMDDRFAALVAYFNSLQ